MHFRFEHRRFAWRAQAFAVHYAHASPAHALGVAYKLAQRFAGFVFSCVRRDGFYSVFAHFEDQVLELLGIAEPSEGVDRVLEDLALGARRGAERAGCDARRRSRAC